MNYKDYNPFDIRLISDTPVGQRPTLRQGDTGTWVSELQRELTQLTFYSGVIDGVFGSMTDTAVRAFQTNNKLTADGVVGRNTWSALVFLYSPLASCPGSGIMPAPFKGVVIDAGHGGTDPGAIGNGIVEKEMNLAISMYINDRFYELNIPHAMTRITDETLENTERINRIKNAFGDEQGVILISNHINAGGGEGAEVIYALRNTATYPTMILNEIKLTGQITRRVFQRALPDNPTQDYYYLMRLTTNLQPVIVEYGFLDNEVDALRLRFNWMRYAEAVVKATCDYIGYPYRPPYVSEIIYTVVAGDTLFSIAQKFKITVEELMRTNNLTSTTISIGQRLKIPMFVTEPEPPEETFIYTVVAGDSLWSIAQRFGTTVAEIRRLNNLTSDLLSIGQQLRIPGTEPEQPAYITHTVVAGDSLWSIAQRYSTTVNEIMQFNGLTTTLLSIGQQLKIPTSAEIIHTVIAGDSLWSIAQRYSTTVNAIMQLNGLTTTLLSIGQQLRIPR